MRKRTEPFETSATITYMLDSGRTVYVKPIKRSIAFSVVKKLASYFKVSYKEISALANIKTVEDIDNASSEAFMAADLASYALFGLCIGDPDYMFDTALPDNVHNLTPEGWFDFSSAIASETEKRPFDLVYSESDIQKVVSLAGEAVKRAVEEEKKS